MTKYETTKNTLSQLNHKMHRGHWIDIQILDEEDSRYSVAVDKSLAFIKEVESLWEDYKSKSNPVDLIDGLASLMEERYEHNLD